MRTSEIICFAILFILHILHFSALVVARRDHISRREGKK